MRIAKFKRVLITGGAGFVGSHLCEHYLDQGCEVVCLDSFYTGSKTNIAHLLSNPRFRLVVQDVETPFHCGVDLILNMACPASPVHYQRDPLKTIRTNFIGMTNMLNLACLQGARILQASTSEVYGDPAVHPQPESYWGQVNPIGIRSCYDEGKRIAETLCFDYHRMYGVDIRVARIFNTYGPHMAVDDGRVVSNFIVQALKGDDITMYGDGCQTRSFCFVSDLVRGLTLLAEQDTIGPVNLGNDTEFTVEQLASEVLAQIPDSCSPVVRLPLPADDPKVRRPDLTLARTLGYEPKVSLREGLAKSIPYFRKMLNQELPWN